MNSVPMNLSAVAFADAGAARIVGSDSSVAELMFA